MITNRKHLVGGALVAALTLGLVACGDDDSSADADPPAETSDDGPEVVEIVAVDFAYEGVPASIDVGTPLTLRNDAERELHEIVAFRLADDETRTIDEIMALPPEEMQAALGPEPSTVILAAPGGESIPAVGDGSMSERGHYALICMIPTGVDPDEYLAAAETSAGPPEVGDGPPHIVHGMYAELEVR